MAIHDQPKTIPVQQLTRFQIDLLVAIETLAADSEQPPYGLAIKRELEDQYSESKLTASSDTETARVEVHHGRLYPNLDTLVEHDLVEKGTIDDRTNWYALTDNGEEMLQQIRGWVCNDDTKDDVASADA